MSDLHEAAQVVRNYENEKIAEVSEALAEKDTPIKDKALEGKELTDHQAKQIEQAEEELLTIAVRQEAFNPPFSAQDPKHRAERELEKALTNADIGENVAKRIVEERNNNIQEVLEGRDIAFGR